jgi:hypothetical protein
VKTPPGSLQLRLSLLQLIQNNGIEFLDISGQAVGEATVIAILESASRLRDFRFDRVIVTNCEALIVVLRQVITKESLKFSIWPGEELLQ